MPKVSPELIDQARRADVKSLLERYSQLKRVSGKGEWSGPCPKCGGHDRLHCTAEWFFCRQCHERRGDAIEALRWLTPGLEFAEAVQQLTGGAALPAPARKKRAPVATGTAVTDAAEWRRRASALVEECAWRLLSVEGQRGADYLHSRCIEPRAWTQFRVGYRPDAVVPGTGGKLRAPAITIPWYDANNRLVAVRYRFLEPQNGHKITAETGSAFSGRLFGVRGLPEWAMLPEAERIHRHYTLLLVEGEINAMSVWQVAADTRLHVLSVGSESAKLSDAAVAYAQRYGQVLIWLDKADAVMQMKKSLPDAVGIQSPDGQDANDLHRQGLLGAFLARVRAKHAEDAEALVWALYDGARTLFGLDTGTAYVLRTLADQIGARADLTEPMPGWWLASDLVSPERSNVA